MWFAEAQGTWMEQGTQRLPKGELDAIGIARSGRVLPLGYAAPQTGRWFTVTLTRSPRPACTAGVAENESGQVAGRRC
jgi:hypothetical protein